MTARMTAVRPSSVPRYSASGVLELDRRVNALVRIYSVQMTVDEKGVGTPTLTVTPS